MLNLVGSKRRKLTATILSLCAVVDAFGTGHLFLSECDRACHSRTLTAFGIELGRTKRYICALCWKSIHLHPRRSFPGVDLNTTQGGKIMTLAGSISRLFRVIPKGDGGSQDGTQGPELHPGTLLLSSHGNCFSFFWPSGPQICFRPAPNTSFGQCCRVSSHSPFETTQQTEARQQYTVPRALGCPLDRKPGFTCCMVVAAKAFFPPQ